MKRIITRRLLWLLWIGGFLTLVADWLRPVSDGKTRLAGVVLFFVLWGGLIPLVWRYRVARFVLITLTIVAAVFMVLPGRSHRDPGLLRRDFTAGLRRYTGVPYDWGGESPKGIDCSGLMRRGLVDGMFLRGIASADPGLVRYSIWLWWHDCTAADLGNGHGATTRYFTIKSIKTMDPSRLLPGDMAVTTAGVHVMGYLGEGQWIEADPTIGRVIIDTAPSAKNPWFSTPMNIVRWKVLESGAP